MKRLDHSDHGKPVTLGGDPPAGECYFRYATPPPCAYGGTLLTHPTASGEDLHERRSETEIDEPLEVWRGLRDETPGDEEHRDVTG